MDTFSRGLEEGFVEALNREYDKDGSWWKGFVDDKDLFLAIRDNYVNVYYRGCSLLKLTWQSGSIIGEIHYKYLLRPKLTGHEYIDVRDGKVSAKVRRFFVEDLTDIEGLKRAAKLYTELEKIGVHDIVLSNFNVLDVEIAFGGSRKRIDFSILRKMGNDVNIVFFEAKHFGKSKGTLRATGNAKPEVIHQIERYTDLLRKNRDAIIGSYRRVCCNLLKLNGVDKRNPECHKMLDGVVDGSRQLDIDAEPQLVVFGFYNDQKMGKIWHPHREKLKSQLGERVVHFVGNSKKFKCKAS